MKKKGTRKLTLSRETLRRLEDSRLREAVGAGTRQNSVCVCATDQESICFCFTDVCASEGYTLCPACNM
jgi:hypothetical protein